MSPDEQSFLSAICDRPDDDTVRLVYADWLEESGQPARGEFIRGQVELAGLPPGTPADERRRAALFAREAELWKAHGAKWLEPFRPYARRDSFSRGFVQRVEVPANLFLQNAERWFALTPLTRVKFTPCRVWDQVRGVYTRLRELVLADNEIGSEGARVLAGMRQLGGLESLDVRGNRITDRGARSLAQSEHLGRLRELRITKNAIRDRNWAVLEGRFGNALS